MKPLISVIVPVYNVEPYLNRCINSVLEQTYRTLEVVLVDDGSTDRSGDICDIYAKNDSRVKVIHKKNGGASSARNLGLDNATGEYVAFVDSDDWLESNMYESLMSLMLHYDADIAECGFEVAHNIDTKIRQLPIEITVLSKTDTAKAFFDGSGKATILPFNKLFNRKLFDTYRFPEGMICEDQWLMPKIYMMCSKTVYSNQKYYYYYQSPNSVMRSPFGKKNLAALVAFEETRNLYIGAGMEDAAQLCDSTYCFLLIKYYNLSRERLEDKAICKKIKQCYNNRLVEYLYNKHLSLKQKLLLLLFAINPQLYQRISQNP